MQSTRIVISRERTVFSLVDVTFNQCGLVKLRVGSIQENIGLSMQHKFLL